MTGMSCAFIFTKSLDLPLYHFPFFSICTIVFVITLTFLDDLIDLVIFVFVNIISCGFDLELATLS
jgi:hypothetical protein